MTFLDVFRLDGKRLFISGGSRGLGREMVLAMAACGADVFITGRDSESLEEISAEVRALGRVAETIAADMSDPAACEEVCRRALESGPIHIVINNVGGRRESTAIENQSYADWRRLLDLNLTSYFICTRLLGQAMLADGRGGRIINVASVSAWKVLPEIGGRHYEAAKAAIVQFTRSTAADWATSGVTVNAIAPGMFATEPNERWARQYPDLVQKFRSNIPMKRFGQPSEIAPLAVYLASDASRYMTGAILVIDGGASLW